MSDETEELLAAATRMRAAANDIKQAALTIKDALYQHQSSMDRWLSEFRRIQDGDNRLTITAAPIDIEKIDDDDIPF